MKTIMELLTGLLPLLITMIIVLLVMIIDEDFKYKVLIFLFNPRIIEKDDPRYGLAARIERDNSKSVTTLYHTLTEFSKYYKLRKDMYIERGGELLPLEPSCPLQKKLFNDFLNGKRYSSKQLEDMEK